MLTDQQQGRFSDAIDRLAGDESMFLKVAEIVAEDAPRLISEVDSSISGNDFETAATRVHKLKGLLATFVDSENPLVFKEMMDGLKANDATQSKRAWASLKPHVLSVLEEVEALTKP